MENILKYIVKLIIFLIISYIIVCKLYLIYLYFTAYEAYQLTIVRLRNG